MIQCGILTFQYAYNYGALLQAYALKTFLENNKIEVEIINYANLNAKEMYKLFPAKVNGCVDFLRKGKRSILRLKQYCLFKRFTQTYLGYKIEDSFQSAHSISGKYRNIVVGSDQVWNLKLTNGDSTYFLEGINCENRISYAASFGSSYFVEKLNLRYINLLKMFNHISVRELEAQKRLQELIRKDVSLVVDPVFLLNKNEWGKIEERPKSIKGKFGLLVTLVDDQELIKQCEALAVEYNVEVVCIHPMGWKQKYGRQLFNVGPLEFVWLIDHAEFIVTNSFHATAFSVIFKKKIVTKPIDKNNDRINSLVQLLVGPEPYQSSKLLDTSLFDESSLYLKIKESKEYIIENII